MNQPIALQPRHVVGAALLANRYELIRELAKFSPKSVAEIGVELGHFSAFMIETLQPKEFAAFDLFQLHQLEKLWGRPTAELFSNRSHRDYYENRFAETARVISLQIFEGDSSTNLEAVEDAHYDLIYIDGDHERRGVQRDAEVAVRKLAPRGTLVFNDYIFFDHIAHVPYGVVQVVNELCVNRNWRVSHFAFAQNMFCDIALRRDE